MRLFLQLADSDGLLHEVAVPAYCHGATLDDRLEYAGAKLLRLNTASGPAQITMPADYQDDWTIAGYRFE